MAFNNEFSHRPNCSCTDCIMKRIDELSKKVKALEKTIKILDAHILTIYGENR